MRAIRPSTTRPGIPTVSGAPSPHRSPVLLEDFLADLHWPRLLGAWQLALAPGRVLICFGLLVGLALLDRLYALAAGWVGNRFEGSPLLGVFGELGGELLALLRNAGPVGGLTWYAAGTNAYELFIGVPLRVLGAHWPLMLLVVPLVVVAFAITAGAVCRSVAMQVSLGATLPWRSASRFGFGRALSLSAALAGPVLLIWLIGAITAGVGHLLFAWNVTSVVAAVGFGLFMVVGLALAVLSLGYVLASPLIIPAFACEGTDTFDAVQRGYSYALARPGRLVAYYLLGGAIVVVGALVAGLVVFVAGVFVQRLTGAPIDALATVEQMERAPRASVWIINLWLAVPIGVLAAYLLSLVLTVSTMVYLIMRRVVDGQDVGELWVPSPEVPGVGEPAVAEVVATEVVVPEKADYT